MCQILARGGGAGTNKAGGGGGGRIAVTSRVNGFTGTIQTHGGYGSKELLTLYYIDV